MTAFDPVKALNEQIAGMSDVARVIAGQLREATVALADAETKYEALVKMDAFMRSGIATMHDKLRTLEREAEQSPGLT